LIKITQKGDFKNTEGFFKRVIKRKYVDLFHQIGEAGVKALKEATPKKTGKTAESWSYTVEETKDGLSISWNNSNRNDGANVAILIQLGHGTGTGAYVKGVDYINPALKPVFDAFANKVWWEVTHNAYGR
jgi:hypothetical protein